MPKVPATGGCYCGAIKYEVDDELQGVSVCYCDGCKTISSGATQNLRTDTPKIRVIKGTPKVFVDTKCGSGKEMKRKFCGECGTSLFSEPGSAPGLSIVKAGTLDERDHLKVGREVFCENGNRLYEPMPKSDHPQYTRGPDSAEWKK